MARMERDVDIDNVEDDGDFDLLPADWYMAHAIKSEQGPTKKGGKRWKITWEIIDGQYEKRRVFDGINIVIASPEAQKISDKTCKRLYTALGVVPEDDQDILEIPCWIKVKIKPADGNYDAQNEVGGYRGLDDGEAEQAAPAPQQRAPQRQATQAAGRAPARPSAPAAPSRAAPPARGAPPARNGPPSRNGPPPRNTGERPWAGAPAGELDDDIPF